MELFRFLCHYLVPARCFTGLLKRKIQMYFPPCSLSLLCTSFMHARSWISADRCIQIRKNTSHIPAFLFHFNLSLELLNAAPTCTLVNIKTGFLPASTPSPFQSFFLNEEKKGLEPGHLYLKECSNKLLGELLLLLLGRSKSVWEQQEQECLSASPSSAVCEDRAFCWRLQEGGVPKSKKLECASLLLNY